MKVPGDKNIIAYGDNNVIVQNQLFGSSSSPLTTNQTDMPEKTINYRELLLLKKVTELELHLTEFKKILLEPEPPDTNLETNSKEEKTK